MYTFVSIVLLSTLCASNVEAAGLLIARFKAKIISEVQPELTALEAAEAEARERAAAEDLLGTLAARNKAKAAYARSIATDRRMDEQPEIKTLRDRASLAFHAAEDHYNRVLAADALEIEAARAATNVVPAAVGDSARGQLLKRLATATGATVTEADIYGTRAAVETRMTTEGVGKIRLAAHQTENGEREIATLVAEEPINIEALRTAKNKVRLSYEQTNNLAALPGLVTQTQVPILRRRASLAFHAAETHYARAITAEVEAAIAQAERLEAERLATEARRTSAATRIQSLIRGHKGRHTAAIVRAEREARLVAEAEAARLEETRRTSAATRIQAVIRGHKGRQIAAAARAEREARMAAEVAARAVTPPLPSIRDIAARLDGVTDSLRAMLNNGAAAAPHPLYTAQQQGLVLADRVMKWVNAQAIREGTTVDSLTVSRIRSAVLRAYSKPWEELRLTLSKYTLFGMLENLDRIFGLESAAVPTSSAIAHPSATAPAEDLFPHDTGTIHAPAVAFVAADANQDPSPPEEEVTLPPATSTTGGRHTPPLEMDPHTEE